MKASTTILALALSAFLSVGVARAEGVVDAVVAQLAAQGYQGVQVNRTLLGRVRIVAVNEQYRREIIINPRTGEILRDYWAVLNAGAAASSGGGTGLINPPSEDGHSDGNGGGHGGGDDDDDDDEGDDDEHEDRGGDDD